MSYATLATELILKGESGLMVALHNGKYSTVPVASIQDGVKRVDVDQLYDVEQYRPKVHGMMGKPMFLY